MGLLSLDVDPRADIDDLLQEIFVVLYRHWPTLDTTRPLRPWLFGVAFRVVRTHRRRRARETPSEELDLEDCAPGRLDALPDARLTALMPGRVVKVLTAAGDTVAKGQALLILEAMKMEHTIVSPREGTIERVAFAENDLVPADALLVTFRE